MKELSRTVGICGAPFDRTENEMETLAFVLVRMDGRIEGISKARVETDGTDSTEAIIGEIQKKYSERCNYIMMPGGRTGHEYVQGIIHPNFLKEYWKSFWQVSKVRVPSRKLYFFLKGVLPLSYESLPGWHKH